MEGSHCDYSKEEKEIGVGGMVKRRRKERGVVRRREEEREEIAEGIENKGEIFYLPLKTFAIFFKSREPFPLKNIT